MLTRREFLRTTTVAGGAVIAGRSVALAQAATDAANGILRPQPAPLSILILGGTGFIGPHPSGMRRLAVTRSRSSPAAGATGTCHPVLSGSSATA
jgi:hypothetical protein